MWKGALSCYLASTVTAIAAPRAVRAIPRIAMSATPAATSASAGPATTGALRRTTSAS